MQYGTKKTKRFFLEEEERNLLDGVKPLMEGKNIPYLIKRKKQGPLGPRKLRSQKSLIIQHPPPPPQKREYTMKPSQMASSSNSRQQTVKNFKSIH